MKTLKKSLVFLIITLLNLLIIFLLREILNLYFHFRHFSLMGQVKTLFFFPYLLSVLMLAFNYALFLIIKKKDNFKFKEYFMSVLKFYFYLFPILAILFFVIQIILPKFG